jgi:transcriptional regulator with XRE-family HTH domain
VTLLQRLKGDPATAQIPVLVCSADPRLLEALHAQLVAWDCAVLAKPFDLEAFLTTIQMCLARRPSPTAPDLAGHAAFEPEGDAPGRAGARPAAAGGTGDGAGSGGRSSSSLAGAGADPRRQRPEPRRPGGDRRRMLGRAGAERLADPAGDGRHLDPPDPTRTRAVAGVGALLLRPPMDTAQQTEPTLSSPVRTPSPPCALGAVIKAERCRRGWSQEAFAARVVAHGDVSFRQSDVSRLEREAVALPRRERLRHIAAVLELPFGALLARAGWEGAETIDAPAASPPEAAARPQQMTDDRAGRTPRPIVPDGGSRSWEAALREARVLLDQVQALLACCEPTRSHAEPAHDFGPDTDG